MIVKYCGAACQKKHWATHKKPCKQRAAELHDEALFKDRPPRKDGECPFASYQCQKLLFRAPRFHPRLYRLYQFMISQKQMRCWQRKIWNIITHAAGRLFVEDECTPSLNLVMMISVPFVIPTVTNFAIPTVTNQMKSVLGN